MMNEIANILGVEEVITKTQGWFAVQTPAIKNIINKMTGDELTTLNIQVEEIAVHGYNEILQQRSVSCCSDADANANANRLAEKYNGKQWNKQCRTNLKKWR